MTTGRSAVDDPMVEWSNEAVGMLLHATIVRCAYTDAFDLVRSQLYKSDKICNTNYMYASIMRKSEEGTLYVYLYIRTKIYTQILFRFSVQIIYSQFFFFIRLLAHESPTTGK